MLAAVAALTLAPSSSSWEREILYQIFPRSFRDSNGDRIGDLRGIAQKLDYLRDLGVTAILLNPIAESRVYHNYFADDFLKVDREFGTDADLRDLIRRANGRGIKVLLDIEPQYVTERHPWLRRHLANPNGPEKDYVWTTGSWLWGMKLPWFDDSGVQVAAINPDHPVVRRHIRDAFLKWARMGVRGFRIDHMMDDLDNKGVKKNLLAGFWRPILDDVRRRYPGTFLIAEQADWGLGRDHFAKANVDAAYAMPLWAAIKDLDPKKIARAIAETAAATPAGRTQVVFSESHDVDRFASTVNGHPGKVRLGLVIVMAVKGTPMLYYGQELGMRGRKGPWPSDGSDIPMRLAFEWNRRREAPGTALWYKGTGPWWSDEFAKDDDGISVEEQAGKPSSLLEFTRRLIALRRGNPALREGSQRLVDVGSPQVLAIERRLDRHYALVLANLSGFPQRVSPQCNVDLWTRRTVGETVIIPPFGFQILSRR